MKNKKIYVTFSIFLLVLVVSLLFAGNWNTAFAQGTVPLISPTPCEACLTVLETPVYTSEAINTEVINCCCCCQVPNLGNLILVAIFGFIALIILIIFVR